MIKLVNVTMQVRFMATGTKLQQAMQLGRIFNKVMQSDRTKKNLKAATEPPPVVNFNRGPVKATTHKNRRVTVLNKVFMKYITDFMATGEVGSKLVNKGIEISHVNVASDFSVVHVYWFSQSGNITDGSVQKLLHESAGHLQHELSQLRVIGIVPPINFIKNKQYSVVKEVEELLAKVDFGEDYTPTAHIMNAKVPTLETSLSAELKTKIFKVDGTNCNSNNNEIYKFVIPEMRQDVMGFDHSKVMERIMGSINKAQMAEQNRDTDVTSEPKGCEEPTSEVVIDFISNREQNKLFADFLKKRKIEEKKKQRSINLLEVKMQEEMHWLERINDDWETMGDINIDDGDNNHDLSSKDR
ncbi:uncharacterized protein LOC131662766 [Phymastichus coffea]|uniref:uncharacterized protein LOC131662766 n=1 Tax=Phymastichus coffea TaxID=108790 RepID=UPI00273B236D|nr:uncharacterized protein LOC131662766 [Phymastichus coffea]XP_058788656.1 uncharacterized protein LOC131662766 [Phymastichus coffea]XP_058788657.1 uncharacterized protein LOC131662766 [Phymastichus coffea]